MNYVQVRGAKRWIWSLLMAALMTGCKPEPIIGDAISLCLTDTAGASKFIEELRTIAGENNMKFIDDSADGQRRLAATGYRRAERKDGSPFIQISVENSLGHGFWAMNDTAPGYQVRVFFLGKAADPKARVFAEYVTQRLAKTWPIRFSTKDGSIPTAFNACEKLH